jgi:hypothetical protein
MGVFAYVASWYVVKCCEKANTKFSVGGVLCRHRQAFWAKIGDILTRPRHVANMLPTFPAKNNSLIFRTGVSCFSVTLFYSTLLALTDGQNHRQRVKYTRYAWAGETFFPAVLLCQFFVLAGNKF